MTNTTLPELVGSERQVAWAMEIRGSLAVSIEAYTDSKIGLGPHRDARRARLAEILTEVAATHVDASWWINNRRQRNETMSAVAHHLWNAMVYEDRMAAWDIVKTTETAHGQA